MTRLGAEATETRLQGTLPGMGRGEDGAVLLTTLLVMSLMATLAVSVIEDVTYAVRRVTVIEDTAQADAYLQGAEGFVAAQLRELTSQLDEAEFNALLSVPQLYTLPITDGVISLSVSDGTHCVSPADVLDAGGEGRFSRLLVAVGVPRNEAAQMTASLADWQDEDQQPRPSGGEDGSYLLLDPPYRTAGSPVTSISELRAVRGFEREVWEMVAPWMCIDDAPNRINVNTLPAREAGLLAASLAREDGFAQGLLSQRPAGGWTSEGFFALDGLAPEPGSEELSYENPDLLTFFPDRVRVDIRVAYRDTVRRGALRVDLTGNEPEIVHTMRGEAALPRPKFTPDEDEDEAGNGGTDNGGESENG